MVVRNMWIYSGMGSWINFIEKSADNMRSKLRRWQMSRKELGKIWILNKMNWIIQFNIDKIMKRS